MNKVKLCICFSILSCVLPSVAGEIQHPVEQVLAGSHKVVPYVSGVVVKTTRDEVKEGYEFLQRQDGTCFKRTTRILEIRKVASAVPNIMLELPDTQVTTEDVRCDEIAI